MVAYIVFSPLVFNFTNQCVNRCKITCMWQAKKKKSGCLVELGTQLQASVIQPLGWASSTHSTAGWAERTWCGRVKFPAVGNRTVVLQSIPTHKTDWAFGSVRVSPDEVDFSERFPWTFKRMKWRISWLKQPLKILILVITVPVNRAQLQWHYFRQCLFFLTLSVWMERGGILNK